MRRALALGVALSCAAATALAEDPLLRIELNKLEAGRESCRAWLVVDNRGPALSKLTLDLVTFDPDGVIAARLAVELGPLRAEKTVVKAFPLRGAACDQVGRVLLNEVTACDGARRDCMALVETGSRVAAEFVK